MLIATVIDFNDWENKFYDYLIDKGYAPSTAKHYLNRVRSICDKNNIHISQIASQIDSFIESYETGANKSVNIRCHKALSNALKQLKEFMEHIRQPYTNNPYDSVDKKLLGKIIF